MIFSENYIEYVKKTANPVYTVEMAACALLEEWCEFCKDNTVDELGDIYYQFILLLNLLDNKELGLKYDEDCEDYISFTRSVLAITSQFKKLKTRKKPLDWKIIQRNLNYIYSDIIDATEQNDWDVEYVEEYNIAKLDKRYQTTKGE